MTYRKLKVGIIGLGGHQQGYGGSLAKRDDVEIVAIHPGSYLSEEENKKRLNGLLEYISPVNAIPVVADLGKMLENGLDLVSIAVDAKSNPGVVIKALKSGAGVICEKPVAVSSGEAAMIMQAVEETGKTFSWNAPLSVFGRPFDALGELLQHKLLTEPRYGVFTYIANCFMSNPSGGTSEIDNFGPYGFLAFRHVIRSELSSVFARGNAFFYDSYKQNGTEDLAVINLQFENGASGIIVVGRSSSVAMPQEIQFKLFSKDGAVDISNGSGEQVRFYSDLGESRDITVSATPMDAYIEDVICAINENRQPTIDIYDAFAVARFCELCRESIASGQPARQNPA
ncbi:MAG: Gfo/Idh/MocA family oxidoreductase [Victivallaceae bacterium]|jgi:myo-inositol 2-dehydrogenase/D-chiro-inositol 1-dehydrogenase